MHKKKCNLKESKLIFFMMYLKKESTMNEFIH